MAFTKDKKTGFSNAGFRGRRVNPDGSYPSPMRTLGFVGTVDIAGAEATDKLSYRLNGKGVFTDITIDLTGATTAVAGATTVDEMVTALNADVGFSILFLAAKDTVTDRLNVFDKDYVAVSAPSAYTYLEFKGDVAVFLGIGKYGDATAMGTAFVECYDRAGAIAIPKNIKDGEEIEQENNRGSIDTMMIDAILKGVNPSIAVNEELYELKLMLMGGSWDEALAQYTPPTSKVATAPLCAFELFQAKYGAGSSHRGDATGYKMYILPQVTGREGDLSADVKSWATYQFELIATEYEDEDGVLQPAYKERELTLTQVKLMGVLTA